MKRPRDDQHDTPTPSRLRVKGWEKFQHYKHRSPPWIKLHVSLLSDYEFTRLKDPMKGHLVLIWLLAAGNNGEITDDALWVAKKIGATSPVNLVDLIALGWLERKQDASEPLAPRKQLVSLSRGEERRELPVRVVPLGAPAAVKGEPVRIFEPTMADVLAKEAARRRIYGTPA